MIARRTMLAGLAATPALAAQAHGLVERIAATLSAHDMAGFADLFAEDYVNHQQSAASPPPPAGRPHKAGTVAFFAARLAGIPDLRVSVEAALAEGDRIAASFVYEGTHGGTYYGVPATGRKLRFTSCDIYRVRDGRLVEHWGMGDLAGVLAQLKA